MSAGSQPTGKVIRARWHCCAREGISTEGTTASRGTTCRPTPDIVVTVCASAAGETCPAYLGPGAAHALGRG